jgi:hypothetical protein
MRQEREFDMNEAETGTVLWRGSMVEARTELAEDWRFLVGCEVDVRRGRRLLRTGVIEAATDDGSIVWLSRQGVQERRLLTKSEGSDLWITKEDNQRVLERMGDG